MNESCFINRFSGPKCFQGFQETRPCLLFCTLGAVLTLESVDETLKCDPIHMKGTKQYFPVVLFIRQLQRPSSLDRILKCYH